MTEPAKKTDQPKKNAQGLPSQEELLEMIRIFNETTADLQQSHRKLQEQVVRLQAELEEKNRELARKNRLEALGQMAAGVAHEIRNPLGGIQLFVSMLEKDCAGEEEKLRLISKVTLGIHTMNRIVEDMLAYTRNVRAQKVEGEIHRTLETAVAFCENEARQKKASLLTLWDTKSATVSFDPHQIERAVLNLVLNAIQASPEGGEVRVESVFEEKALKISISDQGQGVPPPNREKIFNPFFTTKSKGTGLGLAIVHRIAENHDGKIWVEDAPGGGAKFVLELPR